MIEVIATLVAAVGGPAAWYFIKKGLENYVRITRIETQDNFYADQVVELYRERFNDAYETNLKDEEIRLILDRKFPERRISDTENIVLAAILKGKVVGFIYCPFYSERSLGFVSYFAVKSGTSIDSAIGEKLLSKLKVLLTKEYDCDAIYFETQAGQEGNALRKHLVRLAKKIDLEVSEFDFRYEGPRVSLEAKDRPVPLSLLGASFRKKIPDLMSKHSIMSILEFLFVEVYGDLYPVVDERFLEHQKHLRSLLEQYEITLPDTIPTIKGDRMWRKKRSS